MSLRAADLRFLLPRRPRTALVEPGDGALAQALRACGTAVLDPAEPGPPDLLVTRRRVPARAAGAVVQQGPAVALAPGGQRYLVVGGPVGPSLLCLDAPGPRHYLARTWSRPTTATGRARNAVLAGPLGRLAATLRVGGAEPGLPYPLAAALPARTAARVTGWCFVLRSGDDLQRVVVLVFLDGRRSPDLVVKFGRAPGGPRPGRAERAALGELAVRAPELARWATQFVHTGELDGSELTVERAGRGSPLTVHLQALGEAGLPAALQVLDWAGRLGTVTARDDPAVVPELARDVLAAYDAAPLAARLQRVPSVLAHRDLGCWNVVTDGTAPTVLDWESSTGRGLPVGDVAYLATDVLAERHGPAGTADRPAWVARLWAGRTPCSPLLRRWVGDHARALGLDDDAVGALVTSTWLHHGLSQGRRSQLLGAPAAAGYLGAVAGTWLAHPDLGRDWAGFGAWDAA